MSDVEGEINDGDDFLDDSAHQAAYIYRPTHEVADRQPRKKRKTSKQEYEAETTLPLLCDGEEPASLAAARRETLDSLWARQEKQIDRTIRQVDAKAFEMVLEFVRSQNAPRIDGRLTTGLVVSGPDSSMPKRLLAQWNSHDSEHADEVLVQLRSTACHNLQVAFRSIIKQAIIGVVGEQGHLNFVAKYKRLIPMNYDFELLEIFVQEHSISRVVVSMLDVETFDTSLLSDILSSLSAWSDRIPFLLLLGIVTTVELFESRLSQSLIAALDVESFSLVPPGGLLDLITTQMQNANEAGLFFGPLTIASLKLLEDDQSTSIETLCRAFKYLYCTHFFSNPLSVLLAPSLPRGDNLKSLCEAIRNTPSFQRFCEESVSAGATATTRLHIRDLLRNDSVLVGEALKAITAGQQVMRKNIIDHEPDSTQSRFDHTKLLLHEAFVFNSRIGLVPFTAKPRAVIERALSRPRDYLELHDSGPQEHVLGLFSQPTCILYMLLQDAGTIINLRDLYDAFRSRMFPEAARPGKQNDADDENDDDDHDHDDDPSCDRGDNDDDDDEFLDPANRLTMSLFYRSLSELRTLGMIKGSTSAVTKKRAVGGAGQNGSTTKGKQYMEVDFIAKTSWAGL